MNKHCHHHHHSKPYRNRIAVQNVTHTTMTGRTWVYTQARAFNVGEDMGLQQKLVRHLRTSNIQITLLTILLWDPDRHNTLGATFPRP